MWAKKNTAFVVIHGAGSHPPFKRLDDFARGLSNMLIKSNPDLDVRWRHKLQRHEGWVENYVSLEAEGKPDIDFYEYYWDCYMDHEIGLADVIRWFDIASDGAKRFYDDRPELTAQRKQDSDFKVGDYFRLLGPTGRFLGVLQRLRITKIPILSTVVALFLGWFSKLIVNLAGDVVIYVESDARSSNYAIRQKVLGGAVEELKLLLEREHYEQIIVVGHSLGTVIGYDALNRITIDLNAEGGISPDKAQKITGLVTFGSPLDKVAFFFQQHTPDEAFVRRQVLAHLHAFKSLKPSGDQEPVSIGNPVTHHLDHTRWLNFYHPKDAVSGKLDAYEVDRDVRCDIEADGQSEAHEVYWKYERMYEIIGEELL